MTNTEIVQALKDNEKPFGLMTEEMQAKAEGIRRSDKNRCDFEGYNTGGFWAAISNLNIPIVTSIVRLRPDYKEEQEVVECEVKSNDVRGLYCMDNEGEFCFLYAVTANPDFIGFKYENDQDYIRPLVRMYRLKNSLGSDAVTRMYAKNIDKYEVLTPTHVCFKGKDNE